jgi:hypothetical protein
MAQNFLTSIDLNGNQLIDGVLIRPIIENLASGTPSTAADGQLYYDSSDDALYLRRDGAWVKIVSGVNSTTNAINISVDSHGVLQISADDVVSNGDAGLMTGADKKKLDDATASPTVNTLVIRDNAGRFQAEGPSADKDVANKAYVDAARSGLDVKESVKLATNAALTTFTHLAGVLTSTTDGAITIDGTLLSAVDNGIRILVKNETAGNAKYNGIYVVTDAGDASHPYILTRASDANTGTLVTPGMFTFVESGTAWADSGWILTTDGTINLNTTALTFVQFSAAGQSIAGAGLSKSGNTLDVNTDAVTIYVNGSDNLAVKSSATQYQTLISGGTGTSASWGAVSLGQSDAVSGQLPIANGGTAGSTASGARTNLADTPSGGLSTSTPVLARVSAQNCANATTTTVTHNFGTNDVTVQIYDNSTKDTVYADVVRTSTNVVTVTFATAPDADAYRIVVTG